MADTENVQNADNRLDYTKRPLTDVPTVKGSLSQTAEFAKGGPVITDRSLFYKGTADTFRTDNQRLNYKKTSPAGELGDTEGDNKSETPIKPRK